MEEYFYPVMSFLFAACIGSFLNAVIYRLPRGISLSASRSHCPGCNKLIYWYENIPIVSYLFLRGKCSSCSMKISWSYPLVELVVALVGLFLTPQSLTPDSLWDYFFFLSVFSTFLAIILIDLKFYIIPNVLNIYLLILFLCRVSLTMPWTHWLLGGVLGVIVPAIPALAFYYFKGVEGLGGGDIKLYGVLGVFLGPIGVMHNIFLSCFLGSLLGGSLILLKVIDRRTRIPFGPFIVIVGGLQIFFPSEFSQIMNSLFSFSV